jgi:hypothetical protein
MNKEQLFQIIVDMSVPEHSNYEKRVIPDYKFQEFADCILNKINSFDEDDLKQAWEHGNSYGSSFEDFINHHNQI